MTFIVVTRSLLLFVNQQRHDSFTCLNRGVDHIIARYQFDKDVSIELSQSFQIHTYERSSHMPISIFFFFFFLVVLTTRDDTVNYISIISNTIIWTAFWKITGLRSRVHILFYTYLFWLSQVQLSTKRWYRNVSEKWH